MYKTLMTVVTIIGILFQTAFIMSEYKKKMVAATVLKGLGSLMFVTVGLAGLFTVRQLNMGGINEYAAEVSFAKLIVIGLALGLVGDVMLNLRHLVGKNGQKVFLVGIFFFLIGHILYLVALIPSSPNVWLCVLIGAILAGGLLTYIFKTMDVKPAFKAFGILYLGAVIIMTVVAISIAISLGTASAWIYAVGAILFTASDIILIFNTFGNTSKFVFRALNLSLYYAGQLLIAWSLSFLLLH